MRIISILMIILFPQLLTEKSKSKLAPLDSDFPVLWKVNMGMASFRSNVNFTDKAIIIGSNGDSFMDAGFYDKSSGVYVIDRKTGKIMKHIANENLGDMDVNGVLLYNNKYYFGNDNEEFLCTDTDGKIIWRNPASGDIEHEPLLLNANGRNMIVYASETGEVKAVDPSTGNKIWAYFTPDFSGYKPGDNRLFFKVKSYFSNTQSFFEKPNIVDINRDGVSDLVYLTYDNRIVAINGLNGKLIWQFDQGNNLNFDMIMSGNSRNPLFTVSTRDYDSQTRNEKSCFITIDRNGKLFEKRTLHDAYGEYSLNHISIQGDTSVVKAGDSLFFIHSGIVKRGVAFDRKISSDSVENFYRRDPLFGSSTFSYGNHPRCVILFHQSYRNQTGNIAVDIVSLDNGQVVKRFAVEDNSEMPPQVIDVNKDGFLDLLVSSYDGYLYCYDLKIKVK